MPINWRKPLIYALLYATGSRIPGNLAYVRWFEGLGVEEQKELQEEKLSKLLLHAYRNVPYYSEMLPKSGVITKSGKVNLKNFSKIPVLTKDIIRQRYDDLLSTDPLKSRRLVYTNSFKKSVYENTSGGSTGEPVRFTQDHVYEEWNTANKMYYRDFVGHQIGDLEVRLWGNERDITGAKTPIKDKLKMWLFNRYDLNSFQMTSSNLSNYIKKINKLKPRWIEAYAQSLFELSEYINRNNLDVHSPMGIVSSAGTLTNSMKSNIRKAFNSPVLNRYGTREVGDVACSCPENDMLHVSSWNHYVEVLSDKLRTVSKDDFGKVHITNLNNYSMPFIRYDIGDIAKGPVFPYDCNCGRSGLVIRQIEGREMSVFKTKEGGVVPGEFFIHFVGVVYNNGSIGRFQVIQEGLEQLKIKAVIRNKKDFLKIKPKINNSIKQTMGKDCMIKWEMVKSISPMKSGKYLYTESRLQ